MEPAQLRWLRLDANDLAGHSQAVDDLMARRIDGMTVRNIFTPDEVTTALAALGPMRAEATPQTFGAMLGMPLNQPGADQTDVTEPLDDGERCQPRYRQAFGFDPFERVASVIEQLTESRKARPPIVQGRAANPGNVRWYDGGLGGLRAHAGNEFIELLRDGSMKHLLECTQVTDHMSYFVVLQRPEIGGQLSVFDVLWEHYRAEGKPWEAARRDDRELDNHPALVVDAEPGEMVLFGGGWRWHRVEEVHGERPRITYGGFAGQSLASPDEISFWA